jgi:MinD-like ATPase involved in chromosome partitioning or flagellar assembly
MTKEENDMAQPFQTRGISKRNLTKAITVHSFKGGTGKSNLSANTAFALAKRGWNIALLDFDFRAPSLNALFQLNGTKYYINDWLAGRCELHEVLIDLSDQFHTKGQFQVGFTNPSGAAINEMTVHSLNEEWQARVLQLVLDGKDLLFERYGINFQIFDTSPGFALSSINAILAADELILVIKMDQLDIVGTQHLIKGVYNQTLGKRPELIINKVPCNMLQTPEDYSKLKNRLSSKLGIEVVSIIPCFCEVLENMSSSLFIEKQPDHQFSQSIAQLASHFESAN